MFRLLGKIPINVNLAFSGGVDSLAVAHFLKQGRKNVVLYHFNHGCEYSNKIEEECRIRAEQLKLPIVVGKCTTTKPEGQSLEDFWRRARYKWLRSFNEKFVTCHHLDDVIEQCIISLLNVGESTIIPIRDALVYRPFLITEKADFISYAERFNLIPVHDEYNLDVSKRRNYIRENITPELFKLQPGLHKVMKKRVIKEYNLLNSNDSKTDH